VVGVQFVRGEDVPVRFQPPDHRKAYVQEEPKRARFLAHQDVSRGAAVRGLLEKLQRMGYGGRARVVDH
jgi:hypothetical protein